MRCDCPFCVPRFNRNPSDDQQFSLRLSKARPIKRKPFRIGLSLAAPFRLRKRSGVADKQQRILRQLKKGPLKISGLVAATGLPRSSVRLYLKKLVSDGLVERFKGGRSTTYQLLGIKYQRTYPVTKGELRAFRLQQGLTLEKLALSLGYAGASTIARFELGQPDEILPLTLQERLSAYIEGKSYYEDMLKTNSDKELEVAVIKALRRGPLRYGEIISLVGFRKQYKVRQTLKYLESINQIKQIGAGRAKKWALAVPPTRSLRRFF